MAAVAHDLRKILIGRVATMVAAVFRFPCRLATTYFMPTLLIFHISSLNVPDLSPLSDPELIC